MGIFRVRRRCSEVYIIFGFVLLRWRPYFPTIKVNGDVRQLKEIKQTKNKSINEQKEIRGNYEGQSMLTKNKLHVLLYMLPFLCSSTTASTRHGFFSWVKFVPPSPWQLQYFAAIIQRENIINNTANWKQIECQRKDLRPTSGSISSNSSMSSS